MAAQDRRGGCGCCGFLFSFLLLLLVLFLAGMAWFYWSAANQLNRLSSSAPVTLPPTAADRQIYRQARQKAEHFFSDSGDRSMTLSSVELNDENGKKVATGKLAADAKDRKQLIVPLATPLTVGIYTVKWNVVSVDTHRVNGTYSFRVDR